MFGRFQFINVFFFFFQAEDGIRYVAVTGVQTCALPILALQIRELLEMTSKISVGRLESRALLEELTGHVVERDGKLTNLVRARGHDLLVQLATGDRDRPVRELANRPCDSPGHQRSEHASQHQCDQRQCAQFPTGFSDLSFHPPLGKTDPDRTPPLSLDDDWDDKIVNRLPGVTLDCLLDQEGVGLDCQLVGCASERTAGQLGEPTMSGYFAVGVEDTYVD